MGFVAIECSPVSPPSSLGYIGWCVACLFRFESVFEAKLWQSEAKRVLRPQVADNAKQGLLFLLSWRSAMLLCL